MFRPFSDKARIALDFVVVGAGLSGLAAALCLQRAGHRVLVIEKSDGKPKSNGAIPSSPNMTNIIQSWGVSDKIDKMATHFMSIHYFEGDTGTFLGALTQAIFDEVKRDAVHGFVLFPYGQLTDLIFQLAKKEGVKFRFNTTVVGAETEEGVSVLLSTGEKLDTDVIVGADGFHSNLRPYVADGDEELENDVKLVQVRTTFNLAKIRKDPSLEGIGGSLDWDWWLGEGYIAHVGQTTMTQNQDRDFTLVIVHPYTGNATKENKEWHSARDIRPYGIDIDAMEPRLKRLVEIADEFSVRIYESPAALDSLVDPSSRIVLVGEAAHHAMPSGYHLTAMGIEDAQTLGKLFSRVQRKDQIGRILTAYDEIRQPRAEFVHHYEKQYQGMLRVPRGPVRDVRDGAIRRLTEFTAGKAVDEELIVQMWGGELQIITHDATDKVDDWWGQYGNFITKSATTAAVPQEKEKEEKKRGFWASLTSRTTK